MPATDLPVCPEIPPAPDERFREVASILASGLLRLRTHPRLAAASDIPGDLACAEAAAGEHAAPTESEECGGKALAFRAPARTDPRTG